MNNNQQDFYVVAEVSAMNFMSKKISSCCWLDESEYH